MISSRKLYWLDALGKNILSVRGITAFLSSFGALWLIVEIGNNFSTQFAATMREQGVAFLLVGLGLAVWRCWPLTRFERKLDGRDVCIEVRVGDMFKIPGVLVIGTNSTFDTRIDPELISERSVQGQFTRKYFANERELDLQLDNALNGIPSTQIDGPRKGKSAKYEIGTTVGINTKGVRSFWVAMAHMNEHGTAITTQGELAKALAELWVHIGDRGTTETLVTAAMGSKFGQMPLSRESAVRMLIQSFVAACAETTFCERLVIVLTGNDVTTQRIDLISLRAYLEHVCRYSNLERSPAPKLGVGIG